MKKIFGLLAVAAMGVALTSCEKTQVPTEGKTETQNNQLLKQLQQKILLLHVLMTVRQFIPIILQMVKK